MTLEPLKADEFKAFLKRHVTASANQAVLKELMSPSLEADVPEVAALVENRRAAHFFLVQVLATPMYLTSRRAIHMLMRTGVFLAATRYYSSNGLKALTAAELTWYHSLVLSAVMFDHREAADVRYLRSASLQGLLRDNAFRWKGTRRRFYEIPDSADSDGATLCLHHTADGEPIPRFTATNAVTLMLRCGFGVENAAVESGLQFEAHFASYACMCYLAVAALPERHRTVQNFVRLLSGGCTASRPLMLRTPREKDTPLPDGGTFECKLSGRFGSESSNAFFQGTDKTASDTGDDCLRVDELRDAVQGNRVLVVSAGYGSPSADIVVVIPGYGLVLVACKMYSDDSSRFSVHEELVKMCVFPPAATPVAAACYTEFAKAMGIGRIRRAVIVYLSDASIGAQDKPPKGTSVDVVEGTLHDVHISYLAAGHAFENLYPLLRPSTRFKSASSKLDFPAMVG